MFDLLYWANDHKHFLYVAHKKNDNESYKKYRLVVAHANCEQDGKDLIDKIINYKTYNIEQHYLVKLSGGLGSHAGPGALVAGLQELD